MGGILDAFILSCLSELKTEGLRTFVMTSTFCPDTSIGKLLGNSFSFGILTITLGTFLRKSWLLLALSNPRHGKTIKNWAQRLNFNLSH